MEERKQIEEMVAEIEIANVLCGKPCDICRSDDSKCIPFRMARKLAAAGYREQIEGEWHWISDDDVMCTTCGRVFNSNDNADAGLSSWRFCPNCGAKMKGE